MTEPAPTSWRRSSYCNSGGCVEVAMTDEAVFIRDSKLGDSSPTLRLTLDQWEDLVGDIRAGHIGFNLTYGS